MVVVCNLFLGDMMKKQILFLTVFFVYGVYAEKLQSVPKLIEHFEGLQGSNSKDQEYKVSVKKLVSAFEDDMEIVDLNDRYKLFKAAREGDTESILRFFKKLKPSSEEALEAISVKNNKEQTLLHVAVAYRHKDVLRALLGILSIMQAEGRNISSIINAQTDQGKNTALHYAVGAAIEGKRGWYFVLKLLDAGARLDIKNAEGKTPIDRARENADKNPNLAGFLEWIDLRAKAQGL